MNGRALVTLLALALAGTALLFALQLGLAPRIDEARQAAEERALLDLLPPGSYDNHPLREPVALPDAEALGRPAPGSAWRARREGQVVALLLPVTGQGYEGPIRLLLAIAPDGRLLRSKVLEHRETAGIGDRIEPSRSPWLASLDGVSLGVRPGEWRVRADGGGFDQIAGATLTSRAVLAATQQGLRYFDSHREHLLGAAP
ncbi:RnfABCDGE type electron transport complex subunit G [Pseudomonas tohonis]|uniref:RnfABCDGE type electron transport complex subunit G n=1 Tax=Pseudomonas tohonis TaxID=2725477 RepID=UPI0021DB0168|nr:RnfABCDGE type electron transport complex subunit G [Pseudomonas tohonis]UXY51796.1 RnfABCDGE type electron transport complex subunit G [Pseudomonas tohonis]